MLDAILHRFIPNYTQTKDPVVHRRYGVFAGSVGIALNLLLFAGKLTAGLVTGAISVTADAFNNLSDAASSVVTLVGFRLAGQKPDVDHPFGHGRMEYLSGLLVSLLILLVGVELGKSSLEKILHPETTQLTLLSGTIRENLLMGGAEATDDQLRSALAAADALSFVEGLPGGLDARVGERAGGISEGQAQRIAIARALVRPAGLLLLDEATSALDEDTELAVMRALRDRSPRPTCVVVTHRRSVVSFCDRVLLLREGCLVEDLT